MTCARSPAGVSSNAGDWSLRPLTGAFVTPRRKMRGAGSSDPDGRLSGTNHYSGRTHRGLPSAGVRGDFDIAAPSTGAAGCAWPVEVLDGVWAVAGPGLTGDHDANGWLVELSDGGALLIDGGSAAGAGALVANLATLGYEPGMVRAILASHCHHDHLSFAPAVRALGAGPIHLHEAEQAWARAGDAARTCASLYGAEGVPVEADEALRDGVTLRFGDLAVEVLHTPGHSPGGCSFLFERGGEQVLVAADTMWGGFHPRIGSDEADWRASLHRIADSGADCVLYGHNTIVPARDARRVGEEALARFGFLMDPWFKPPVRARA